MPPVSGDCGAPVPSRVSSRRAGTTGVNRPAAPGVLLGVETQPARSAMTSAWPAASKMFTAPPALRRTSTRLATVVPAVQLRLEATGCGASAGEMVRYDAALVFVTVTFMTA